LTVLQAVELHLFRPLSAPAFVSMHEAVAGKTCLQRRIEYSKGLPPFAPDAQHLHATCGYAYNYCTFPV